VILSTIINWIQSLITEPYKNSVEFIEWLSSSSEFYNLIPKLSEFLIIFWFAAFILWLLEKVFQAKEETFMHASFLALWKLVFSSFGLFIVSIGLSIWVVYDRSSQPEDISTWLWRFLIKPSLVTLSILTIIHIALWWLVVRHWQPKLNYWLNKTFTKTGYQETGISDIRKISNESAQQIDYDPKKYWELGQKKIFIGLSLTKEPIYLNLSEWRTQHQQVLGTTGFGKGVAISNQLAQCLALQQTVIVFDPKNDEWAPSVLIDTAQKYNRPFCVIDLNVDSPQFNPLYGANQKQIFDLFVGSFGLAEGRGDADYYRSHDKRVVRQWTKKLEDGQSLTDLANSLTDSDFDNAPKLCNDLTELALLGCIDTQQKGHWHDIIDQGGLIYIIGSIRSEPVLRLQKMLLLRLMQRLEERDRNQQHTHVTIFLDELKYLLCKPSLQALGTIRDKFANLILAHQSIDDLRDVPSDLDPQAVKSAVLENTALKLIYRSQDPDTIDWISRRSGTIPTHREMLEQTRNSGFSEITDGDRRLLEVERCLIEPNMILALQKRCAVWFSNDIAKVVLTSPVQTKKKTITPNLIKDNSPSSEKTGSNIMDLFS